MRTCDQIPPLLFLFLGLIAALPAGAASPGAGEICGDRYFFEIEGPEGWRLERQESHDGLSLVYMPAGVEGDASPIAMAITLPRNSARSPQVDLDQILNERVATLALFGDPRVIRATATARNSFGKLPMFFVSQHNVSPLHKRDTTTKRLTVTVH